MWNLIQNILRNPWIATSIIVIAPFIWAFFHMDSTVYDRIQQHNKKVLKEIEEEQQRKNITNNS